MPSVITGGSFNGPSIKTILKQEVLDDLEAILPNRQEAESLIAYLTSVREVHRVCTASVFEGHVEVLEEFKRQFFNMQEQFKLTMTLKIHIILEHYLY